MHAAMPETLPRRFWFVRLIDGNVGFGFDHYVNMVFVKRVVLCGRMPRYSYSMGFWKCDVCMCVLRERKRVRERYVSLSIYITKFNQIMFSHPTMGIGFRL